MDTSSPSASPSGNSPPATCAPTRELRNIDLTTMHDQSQSPLFSKIPPEIRNEIFDLALQEYIDPNKLYGRETYFSRPGFEGRKRVDTALLRTCKRVYEETRAVPLGNLELCFYLGNKGREPQEYIEVGPPSQEISVHPFFKEMWPEQCKRIDRIHVFAQMYALHLGLNNLFQNKRQFIAPSTITITIRYTDWWWWEYAYPIYPIRSDRFIHISAITLPNCVNTIVVEFETSEKKEKQLEKVVGEILQRRVYWTWMRKDGSKLAIKDADEEVRTWKWNGPTRFGDGGRYPHHGDGEVMGYVVKVVTWTA
ncbi:hypothetical protein BU26DRAFT_514403 [Trematosphaeria pertusa]|uniref:Uncharacterized protein n=1 Tax=Trematosphaeria pertusa TaxID=390896 RepID=A0A6A6IZB5_9PLEO|nr:uncharacterized protein BU26DRAFT_514403 [Trematosphaeria pertusa]KAF2254503.1 hypothetical protein BU26DRAFT_514403 [Trematosphaeria pertusa]